MQMQFGHGVAQCVAVLPHQLLMEMLHREAAVDIAIKPKHPLDLFDRRTQRRGTQATITQAHYTALTMAVTPVAKRTLTHTKQFGRFRLAQLGTRLGAVDIDNINM